MSNIVSGKLTGAPGSAGWSQAHEFEPNDANKLLLRGRLFVVVSTKKVENGVDLISSGRELINRINEEYYGNTDGKPFDAISQAVSKISLEFRDSWGDVEIAAVVVFNDLIYTTCSGGGNVFIYRNGVLTKIIDSFKNNSASASGYLKVNDQIVLATHEFFETIPEGVLKAALAGITPSDATETLAPMVHGSEKQGSIGALFLKFNNKSSDEPLPLESKNVPMPGNPVLKKSAFIFELNHFVNSILQKIPKRGIYIKEPTFEEVSPVSKKSTFLIAILLLVLLGISIGFGIRQKKINDFKAKYQGILDSAAGEVDQAISLASVSPDKSRELFSDAQDKINQVKSLKVKDIALDNLIKKIDESRSSILGEYNIQSKMYLDLTLLSSGFKGDAICYSGGNIYVLDESGKRVVSVGVNDKKSKVVVGPGSLTSAYTLTCYENSVYVLEDDGIYEVDSGSKKVISKSWAGDAFMTAFAGNLYVLDKSGNTLLRYQGQNNSFGDKQNWLSADTSANFSDSTQIAIDGSVYVLFSNSKISKFSQGSPQNFSLNGIIPEIGNVDAISANPDNTNLYLLDRAGKRVVVTDKKGKYVAQYVDDSIGGAVGLVVSETDKKIILLTGDKLYSVDLQN